MAVEARPRTAVEVQNPTSARRAPVTSDDVWRAVTKASFAYVAHVTPSGEPRVSGVAVGTVGRKLYIVVAPDSWKARHLAASGRAAVVVPVRRGGILSLFLPLPPATISFSAKAAVRPAGLVSEADGLPKGLISSLPAERKSLAQVIELAPEGDFLTYGLGVSLMEMMRPSIAQARVPVKADPRGS